MSRRPSNARAAAGGLRAAAPRSARDAGRRPNGAAAPPSPRSVAEPELLAEIARRRLRPQRLVGRPCAGPIEVVRWMGAVQAQQYADSKWALALRSTRITEREIDRALDAGEILRTHVLRPTWHLVLPEDIRWMLELTAPRIRAVLSYSDRALELTEALYRRCGEVIVRALEGGRDRTRAELIDALAAGGIQARGRRAGHIMLRCELDGWICSGPRRGKQLTYALLSERAPPAKPIAREQAIAELARRYFRSHGPALIRDFAWWSGLAARDAARGVELLGDELRYELFGEQRYYSSTLARGRARREDGGVWLLPAFDELMVAYREVRGALSLAARRGADANMLLATRSVALDGRIIGSWRVVRDETGPKLETKLEVKLGKPERKRLAAMIERHHDYLGVRR